MDDLKIRQKVEEMIAYGYTAVRQFPKSERHVLRRAVLGSGPFGPEAMG